MRANSQGGGGQTGQTVGSSSSRQKKKYSSTDLVVQQDGGDVRAVVEELVAEGTDLGGLVRGRRVGRQQV